MNNKPNHAVAPVIETERLRLRGYCPDDFDDFCTLWNEPEVFRFVTGRPLSEEEHWNRLLRYVGCWSLTGFGSWAVETNDTGEYIGQVGFGDYRRQIAPPMPEPECGWALASAFQDRGFASEACRAILGWADCNLAAHRTACMIDPDNLNSRKLARKLRYELTAQTAYKERPVLLFHRMKPQT